MSISEDTRATREASIGWMIQRIAADLNRRMTERLAELNLPLPTFAVMMGVLEHGPVNQTEIGKHFGMPAYAISRAIDALEELGFVARRAHESSRRAHSIQATEAGEALAPKLHTIVREVNDAAMAGLSAAERKQFGDLLRQVLTSTGH